MTSILYLQLLTYLFTFKNHNSLIPVSEREEDKIYYIQKGEKYVLKVKSKTVFEQGCFYS